MIESRRACPELVERGRLKVVQDCVAAYFQPSLRDWSSFQIQPRTASWAKFSRPCGTEFGNRVLSQALKPSPVQACAARLKPCPSSDDSSAARRARIVAFEFFRLGCGSFGDGVDAGASIQSKWAQHRRSWTRNFKADYFWSAVRELELATGDFEGKLEL